MSIKWSLNDILHIVYHITKRKNRIPFNVYLMRINPCPMKYLKGAQVLSPAKLILGLMFSDTIKQYYKRVKYFAWNTGI